MATVKECGACSSQIKTVCRVANLSDEKLKEMSNNYAHGIVEYRDTFSDVIVPTTGLVLAGIWGARSGKPNFSAKVFEGLKFAAGVFIGYMSFHASKKLMSAGYSYASDDMKQTIDTNPVKTTMALVAGTVAITAAALYGSSKLASGAQKTKTWESIAKFIDNKAKKFDEKNYPFVQDYKTFVQKNEKLAKFVSNNAFLATVASFFGLTFLNRYTNEIEKRELSEEVYPVLLAARDEARIKTVLYRAAEIVNDDKRECDRASDETA